MKIGKRLLCILMAVSLPFSSMCITAAADMTLVTVQPYWKQYNDSDEYTLEGGYYELQPDTTTTPDMPDVLKNRTPKHHIFERREDHSINLRNELIMPGDTFEIPTDITYDYIFSWQFKGRAKDYEEFSPENYGIEVTGSVDIIEYTDFEAIDGDGHVVKDRFAKVLKNNLNCPITLCSYSGGDGPYIFYKDHDQRKAGSDITYHVYAPYYFLSYRFYDDPSESQNYDRISWDEFDWNLTRDKKRQTLFWPSGEFENIDFPEYYWLTDVPYTIKIPNVRKEGSHFSGWNGDHEDVFGDFSNLGEKVYDDYTELTVQWVYDIPNIDELTVEELPHIYSDVNFFSAGNLFMTPRLGSNQRTILFDANGGTINGRDKYLIEVNYVKREDTPKYGESRIPDDGDFGFDINDYIPEKPGDTFLGWCSKPNALYTNFVTKDSTIEAYRYFWENDEYGTYSDKYTRQKLYAKWASETEDAFEKNCWELKDDGTLRILNDDGAVNWNLARKADPTLSPKVKSIQLGAKGEEVTYLPERCFEGCTSLTKLTFGENVHLDAYSFAGCTNLTDVTLNSRVGTWGNDYDVFFEANKDITVHVPDLYLDEYKAAFEDYAYLLKKPKGERYALSVNGSIITDENLTVKCGDGTAVFDPKTNTLTLKNAVLTESMTPHCCDPKDKASENGENYPNAAIVSGLDKLTIVIEGTNDVNTTVSNVMGASKEDLPKFLRAYGDIEIKGSGTIKSTKEDMSFYYKDPETMDFITYVGAGKVGITALSNLTIKDINAERLYLDVSGDFTVNNATLSGGQIIAGGSINAVKADIKPFNAPENDMQLSTELPAISSKGDLSSYDNCKLKGILLSAGSNAKTLTFKDCSVNASYQIRGGENTKLVVTNTSIEMYDDRISVTNIPEKNITLKDCKITEGAWNENGKFVLTATGTTKPEPTGFMIGDLDGDNKITSADSLKILRMSVALEPITNENKPLADVDGDNDVTSADSLDVLRASVGLSANSSIGSYLSK